MCEWLSYGEWCDVYLSCGGRVFKAHRAVLASMSRFLRHVLLSCPIDETPTIIALPEFDFDAMSLVLKYIYNGEVVIREGQLTKFLDIMGTMQILVDSQCILKFTEAIKKGSYNLDVYPRSIERHNRPSVRTIDENKQYVDVRRFIKHCDSRNSESYRDERYIFHSASGPSDNGAGYLKSQWTDRQRQRFLSDLYIETDKVNGNSNGVARGVQQITNEHYREPTSVLSRNANENLKANVTQQEKSLERVDKNDHTRFVERKLQSTMKCNHASCINNENDRSCYIDINLLYNTNVLNDFMAKKYLSSSKTLESRDPQSRCQQTPGSSNLVKYDVGVVDVTKNSENDNITRVAILNKVLQSPWTSLTPNTYSPCRKLSNATSRQKPKDLNMVKIRSSVNDRNNNKSLSNNTDRTEKYNCNQDANLQSFTCNICKQSFVDSNALAVHSKQHSSPKYTCQECQKSFSQLRNYKYHVSVHRGTKEFATTCPICGKFFNDKGYLSSHMKIHRNRKEYKCSMCPKSFNQRVAYNMHIRIHTGVKPHVCNECGKAFSRKMLLKQHQRTHSGERPYVCSHCDKRFADRSNMTLHLRLHTGEKPFHCTLCPKSFTKKHHLKSHLNFHTGEKPYSCPRCNHGFTQSSNMRTHLKKCHAR